MSIISREPESLLFASRVFGGRLTGNPVTLSSKLDGMSMMLLGEVHVATLVLE
jgi:hypothetical protein